MGSRLHLDPVDEDGPATPVRIYVSEDGRVFDDRFTAIDWLLTDAVRSVRAGVVPATLRAADLAPADHRAWREGLSPEEFDEILAQADLDSGLWFALPEDWQTSLTTVALPPEIARGDDQSLKDRLRTCLRTDAAFDRER